MQTGYFALVLHAHLPFVRHPEDPTVMEEQWLYEGITGTYLPLLQMFEGLGAAHHDAHGRPAEGPLRATPRPLDRAEREGAGADEARTALSPPGRDVLGSLPVHSPHVA